MDEQDVKKLSHVLWGIVMGAGLMLGTLTIPSTAKAHETKKQMERFYRGQAGMKADANYSGMLEYNEMYNLGLKLNVIKDGEEISTKELAGRIRNASIEKVKDYVNNAESDKIISF